jgi:coenzyme F420-0:L-glutamate ligase / coenzyme F420-1:gamma-L-glutamate ligase
MSVPSRAVVADIHTFLRSRRSVRRFKPDPVPAPVIERILETAAFAPSAHNLQPWRFAVIADLPARRRLGQALIAKMRNDMTTTGAPASEIEQRVERSRYRLSQAPTVILLCRDVNAVRGVEIEEVAMAVQSVAACGLQLLLAAHAEGLGGNWICWPLYAQETVREALDLPVSWEPQAMFFLGYPGVEPKDKERKETESITIWI